MTAVPRTDPAGNGPTAPTSVMLLARRSLQHELRSVDGLLLGIVLPVLLMLLFVYVFGGAITTGATGLDYVDFVAPAVILLAAGYGAATTATTVALDVTTGAFDRLRTLPIPDWSAPAGHVATSVVKNLASTAIVIAIGVTIGFRPQAGLGDWAVALGIVTLYIVALTWASVAVGLVARSVELAGAFPFFVLFLPYLSSAFVPVETMPAGLQVVAEHQPMTAITDALRYWLLGIPAPGATTAALLWWAGILLVSVPVTAVLFRRRTVR